MNCQTECQLHQLLKTTKKLKSCKLWKAASSDRYCNRGWSSRGWTYVSRFQKTTFKNWEVFKKYKGSVATRQLFYYLNGTLARQLGYNDVVRPQLNHWEIEQPHSLEYFTFGSLSGENITNYVFQDYQLLPYLGDAIPLVTHVGHTSLNLALPPYAVLWIHNVPNEFTRDDVNHLLYI